MAEDNGTKKRGKKGLIIILTIVLVCAVGFGGYQYYLYREQLRTMEAAVNVDTLYDGITINGVDVGGMTREEAKQAVEDKLAADLDVPGITIIFDGQQWDFTKHDLVEKDDADTVLDNAWAMARDGELKDRYRQVLSLAEQGKEFTVDVTFNGDMLGDAIQSIAGEIDIAPVDAQIRFDPKEDPMFTYTEEKKGRETDVEGTLALVRKSVTDDTWGEVELLANDIKPSVTKEQLIPLNASIVDFSTSIKGNTENRAQNVRQALSLIDGFVLGPGETFSFNEVVGNRTEDNGFVLAPVINKDKALVPGLGGGVCQASTTTYNAAIRAGMQVEQRFHHSFPVSYIPKGLDATVSYGTQDLVFTNTRETPVFFHTYYENYNVHVQIFGAPYPDNGEIKCWSEVTETVQPPATVVRADAKHEYVTQPGQYVQYVESRQGYKVTSYQGYYENGELVEKTVLAQDYYKPIQGVILAYPGYEHMTGGEAVTPLPH